MPIKNEKLKPLLKSIQHLSLEILTDTASEENLSVQAKFYSGAQVDRFPLFARPFKLQFSMDPSAAKLAYLNSGNAPVLDSHQDDSVRHVIGVVEKAWIEKGVGMASLRFSDREDVKPIWRDVQNKIIRNISMGVKILKAKDVTPKDSEVMEVLATEWEPKEISTVAIGADSGAFFMASDQQQQMFDVEIERAEAQEETMKEDIPAGKVAEPVPNPAPVVDLAAVRAQAATEERERASGIRKRVKAAKLEDSFGEKLIADGVSLEKAAEMILDKLAENYEANPTRTASAVVTRDADVTRMQAIEAAFLHRFDPQTYKVKDLGREYVGMSLLEVGREILSAHGISHRGLPKLEVAKLALSTSDFPYILANTANKTLKAAYEGEIQTWRPLATQANFNDFKSRTINQLGDAPGLEKVNEGGEFKYGSIPEARETEQLYTYGKILPFTRQALINDDLGAFTRIPAMQGAAASRLESDKVWVLITGNPTMGDSVALFHATHANYTASGTAISVASLGVARAMMRNQKGLTNADGTFSYLNVMPKFLAVPPALETIAQQYTIQVQPNISSSVNPFQGTLTVLAEPRLEVDDANGWYLFASPSQVPIIEFGYLDGQEGPFLESRQGFEIDGIEMKVRLDFGAQIVDYRGAYFNEGA